MPFTTPRLFMSRLRKGERAPEIVISAPEAGGSRTVYILPFSALPDTINMTVHDRMLHEILGDRQIQITPATVRRAMFEVAADGLAGEEAMVSAQYAMEGEAHYTRSLHLSLVVSTFERQGISRAEVMAAASGSDRNLPAKLNEGLRQFGMEGRQAFAILNEASNCITDIGTPALPGRIRMIHSQLTLLRGSLEAFGNKASEEMKASIELILSVIDLTLSISYALFEEVDALTKDPVRLTVGFAKLGPAIEVLVGRLSWLLDGWDQVMAFWNAEDILNSGERVIEKIRGCIPLVPADEAARFMNAVAMQLQFEDAVNMSRSVRALTDWRTGLPDRETVDRIEAIKAAAMARFTPAASVLP